MKNLAAREVLSLLRARGVSLWHIAAPSGVSQTVREIHTRTVQWRPREEQYQLLWLLGWEWSQGIFPFCVTREQAIGQQLLRAVDALWQRKN